MNQNWSPLKFACKGKCKAIYKIFIFIVVGIVTYWLVLAGVHGADKTVFKDPFNKILFELPFVENCCSSWPVSHFILFFVIGVLFPDCDVIAILGGIVWELTEVAGHHLFKQERQSVRKSDGKVEYSQNWWAGSTKDIFFNIAGFYTGKMIPIMTGKRLCLVQFENCTCQEK